MQPEPSSGPEPGPVLYRMVRAGFVKKGSTLNRWCREHGVTRQHAENCLQGKTKGPAADKLIERLISAAVETEPDAA